MSTVNQMNLIETPIKDQLLRVDEIFIYISCLILWILFCII